MADSESDKRQRLAFTYAQMAESELRELAEEAWSLTETAKELLKVELVRRGLPTELRQSAPAVPGTGNLVTIGRFRDEPDAALAKNILESTGIECFLSDGITIGMNWGWSNALGGIKVRVRAEDAEVAAQLLGQEIPERFNVEGAGEFVQPRCPACQSINISLRDPDKPYFGFWLGVPIPLTHKGPIWRCDSCGHEWSDAGDVAGEGSRPK